MRDSDTYSVLDKLPGLVFVADVDGHCIYFSPRLLSFTGRTTSELAGDRWLDIVHPEDRDRAAQSWHDAVGDGGPWKAELRLARHDGEFRHHHCLAEPMPEVDGPSERWIGTFTEAPPHGEADEPRAWLAAIVNASDDAILSKSLDGHIRSWNGAAERIFGYSASEIIGEPVSLIIPADRMDEERSLMDRLRRGEHIDHIETVRVTRDGRRIAMSVTISPVRDTEGRMIGASTIARSITERRRAEQAVLASEAKLNAIIERLPVGVVVADESGQVLSLNPAGMRIHGFRSTAETLATVSSYTGHFELRHPDGSLMPVEEWPASRAVRGEFVADYEAVLCRPDGEERLILYTSVPIPAGPQGPTLVIYVMQDITHRRRTEEALTASRAELRLVTDYAAVMLAHCDRDSRYLFVNRTYVERFGLEAAKVVGRRIPEVIGAAAYASLEPYVKRVLQGEFVEFEVEIAYEALGPRFMHCIYVPEFDEQREQVRGFVAAISDVTERKRLERELVETDRRKNEFLAVLGHELRNPLAPLSTGLELLNQADDKPELVAHVRQVMQRQLAHLVRLVEDLVDVSRISRGMIQLQRATLDLREVVRQAVELARPIIDERRHHLVVDEQPHPHYVHGDFQRLTQVISNLLTNAAKYTHPGGSIHLWTEVQDRHVTLHVRDSGLGIPDEHLESIFEMFSQLPEHRDHVASRGLGIGLALSRQLIDLHAGTIEAQSAGPGKGSEFIVTLELTAPRSEEPRASTRLDRAEPKRILVVDDNVDAADGLQMLLSAQGHQVQVAYDGHAALGALKEFPADVVLLDIGLPGMDGYETARRIRAGPKGRHVLLIALTGWGQAEARVQSDAAGFDEHLTKPVDHRELTALLEAGRTE